MTSRLLPIAAALATWLVALPVQAQPVPTGPGDAGAPAATAPAPGARQGRHDCARRAHPEQCRERQEAFKQASEACKGKAGAERRQCIHDRMPPPDCSKAPSPQRCEARLKAREACKDKAGNDYNQCMREALHKK